MFLVCFLIPSFGSYVVVLAEHHVGVLPLVGRLGLRTRTAFELSGADYLRYYVDIHTHESQPA